MGMSIDESLEWLISRKEHYEMDDNCQKLAQALDTAISTMRKYQKLEQEPTTNNDLGVDCIKKSDAINIIQDMHGLARADVISDAVNRIITMPSVTPQEPQSFKWCETCKEYDQEKHCCHRWSKVIRDTVEEMKQEPILDKIRAEIKALSPEPTAYDVVDGNPIKDAVWETLADVLKIIDKYKAEREE